MAGELLVLIPGQTSVGAQLQFSREFSDAAGLMAMMIVILAHRNRRRRRRVQLARTIDPGTPGARRCRCLRRPMPSRWSRSTPARSSRLALRSIGRDRLAIASSFGAEDVVLIDLLASLEPRPRVFTLDTGRLPQETYDLMDQVRRRYSIDVEVYFPKAERRGGDGPGQGPEPLLRIDREPDVVLSRPQGRAARPGACHGRRLDHRPSPRPDRHPRRDRQDRPRSAARRDLEGRAARRLEQRQVWALHPRPRPAVQRAPRPGLPLDRLRAVHARSRARRGRTRRTLVVGAARGARVRDPLRPAVRPDGPE